MNIKENDIFNWHYTDAKYKDLQKYWNNHSLIYWCKSQICVAKENADGSLYLEDTYWNGQPDSARFEISEVGITVDLEYLGNFAELDKISGYNIDYYKPEDIVNLNHPNSSSGNIYRKKGAKKDLATIKSKLTHLMEEEQRKAYRASEKAGEYEEQLKNLTEENVDKVWF
jgi:hypothetical protein